MDLSKWALWRYHKKITKFAFGVCFWQRAVLKNTS